MAQAWQSEMADLVVETLRARGLADCGVMAADGPHGETMIALVAEEEGRYALASVNRILVHEDGTVSSAGVYAARDGRQSPEALARVEAHRAACVDRIEQVSPGSTGER